jgi:Domain of unknown function (DUF4190)/Protein of unknown function (DUF2510)
MERQVETAADSEEPIPPGWYPEPNEPERERYWDGERWGARRKEPRPTGRANRLAVTALILACFGPFLVGGILATVFGIVSLEEIEDSEGAERGQSIARWAIGLGFVNIVVSAIVIALVVIAIMAN